MNETIFKALQKKINKLKVKSIDDKPVKISDRDAWKLFHQKYKDQIVTDVDGNIFLINEFGIWESIKANNKKFQDLILSFEDEYTEYNLTKRQAREAFLLDLIT